MRTHGFHSSQDDVSLVVLALELMPRVRLEPSPGLYHTTNLLYQMWQFDRSLVTFGGRWGERAHSAARRELGGRARAAARSRRSPPAQRRGHEWREHLPLLRREGA